jgi:hypothetical protein
LGSATRTRVCQLHTPFFIAKEGHHLWVILLIKKLQSPFESDLSTVVEPAFSAQSRRFDRFQERQFSRFS